MEIEKLLSPPDWFNLYQETCTGLLRIGTASCHYRIIYLIYCAAINNKFSGDLEKVSSNVYSVIVFTFFPTIIL